MLSKSEMQTTKSCSNYIHKRRPDLIKNDATYPNVELSGPDTFRKSGCVERGPDDIQETHEQDVLELGQVDGAMKPVDYDIVQGRNQSAQSQRQE